MESNVIFIQLIINGLLIGGIYALLSFGLALIFGVVEVVNFAHGEVLMVGMYLSYVASTLLGVNIFVAMFIGMILFFIFGITVERIIIKPILDAPFFSQIFATVGLAYVLKNVALMIFKADYLKVKIGYLESSFQIGNFCFDKARVVAFLLSVGALLVLVFFLKNTYIGRAISAVAQSKRGAEIRGIDIHKTYAIAFGIGFMCTGLAGFSLSTIYSVYPSVGDAFGLIAFIIVILGGYNNLYGIFIGALIIGQLESLSGFILSVHLKEVVYFLVFLIILVIKPSGLMGGTRKMRKRFVPKNKTVLENEA